MAARHLLDQGYRSFAFCGYSSMFWSGERRDGFVEEIRDAGFEPHVLELAAPSSKALARSEVRLRRWLRELPKPCGLFAVIDVRALEIAELCALEGIALPDEMGLLGMNNDQLLCELGPTPLSSVAINAEGAGFQAAQALDRAMRDGGVSMQPAPVLVHATHIEARASTDFSRFEDPALVKAMRFIRANARSPLTVSQVALASGVSRRSLEEKFRQRLPHSIYEEISRSRAEEFATLLRESNLSITEIADWLGFSGSEHVGRFFKSRTGYSPREYRELHRA